MLTATQPPMGLLTAAVTADRLVAGGEVTCNDNADGFYPAGYIEHSAKAALLEDIIGVLAPRTRPTFPDGLFHAEKFEALVVFVVPARNRGEIGPGTAVTRGTRFAGVTPAFAASAAGRVPSGWWRFCG